MKTLSFHCELKDNDKVKKTISKMAEPPENGVWMVVFLTEVNFRLFTEWNSILIFFEHFM